VPEAVNSARWGSILHLNKRLPIEKRERMSLISLLRINKATH